MVANPVTLKSFRCARCPKQIKPGDRRAKIGRFTYCEYCEMEIKDGKTTQQGVTR
jgi:hypothetical protein